MSLAGARAIGMLVAFLRAFLTGYRPHTLANTVLPVGQLALAGADGIIDVLAPSLWVGAACDSRGSEHGRRHQADRDCNNKRRHPRGAPSRAAYARDVRTCAIRRPGREWRRAKGDEALTELICQPEVELVVHLVITRLAHR